ncbi:MAG: insulinase family protein [Patescibacteria group bacterium]|nr:insulinase family protein [Patescibacteria group bacterium]MDE2172521.1 insulinase family protein [Patescibacteria group bacterium]
MKFTKTILPSGLRLIAVPMPDNPSVTVLVMVEAGSKYESRRQNGLSHFLEHMVFKGTSRRPKAVDISRELDSIGAHYNAFTAQEYTGYYAKADARHFGKILDVISDMYQHPLFDEKEIEKEKGVIVEEIRMYRDLPQSHVGDMFTELLYGDQPAGWNIAGTESNVRSFSRQDLISYRAAHYVASATTVIVSGSFDQKNVTEVVAKAFKDIRTEAKDGKLAVKESQTEPRIKVELKETDQTHLVIGVRTFSIFDPRIPAMHVLSTILGRGMSSRLFAKMRDELGICYYIRTDHNPFGDHGFLSIAAGLDNSRVEEGVRGILGECRRLMTEPVSEAELQKAKDYLSGTTLLELETSDARAEFCGYQETEKHAVESPEQLLQRISAVTSADVRNLAAEIFREDGLNMALIGRYKDGEPFKDYFHFK